MLWAQCVVPETPSKSAGENVPLNGAAFDKCRLKFFTLYHSHEISVDLP